MKEKIIELINKSIKENQEQKELQELINQILLIFENNELEILNNNNSNLVETFYTKYIKDFKNNKSYINSKEIYKGYMQFGEDGIEDYLKQVKLFLDYLKNIATKEKENIKIYDINSLENLKNNIENNYLDLNYDLLNSLIEESNLTKEDYVLLKQYLKNRQTYLTKEELLKDIANEHDIEENSKLVVKLAKDIFIKEIDKLKTQEEKEQKLQELINNQMYGNNKDKDNTISILKYIIKEEIKEEEELKESMNPEEVTEINKNINNLFGLLVFLTYEENMEEEKEEDYFDKTNEVNKIIYSSNILKDIASINDPKTIKDIYNLLVKIKKDTIPIKSRNLNDLILNRKIKIIRPNSNNSQARLVCELLGNNTYYLVLAESKKSNTMTKQTNETLLMRLKQYNPSKILDKNKETNEEIEKEVIDLLNSKTKRNVK